MIRLAVFEYVSRFKGKLGLDCWVLSHPTIGAQSWHGMHYPNVQCLSIKIGMNLSKIGGIAANSVHTRSIYFRGILGFLMSFWHRVTRAQLLVQRSFLSNHQWKSRQWWWLQLCVIFRPCLDKGWHGVAQPPTRRLSQPVNLCRFGSKIHRGRLGGLTLARCMQLGPWWYLRGMNLGGG